MECKILEITKNPNGTLNYLLENKFGEKIELRNLYWNKIEFPGLDLEFTEEIMIVGNNKIWE